MKHTPTVISLLTLGATTAALSQSHSSSASYDLLHAPPGGGGGQVTNGSAITAEISVGGGTSGQVSNVTANGVQEKPNYIGQLYDVIDVTVSADPSTIDEGGTRQLGATATMDDSTTLAPAAGEVNWSVVLGPLTGIDAAGLATADLVVEDTPATAQGTWQGASGQLGLTVLDTIADNYREYGGDGVGDGWQVEHFGEPPNPDAGPGENPDGDPHDNLFESLTGFDPNDGGDFLDFFVLDRSGTTATLRLSKVIPGTRYTVKRSTDLGQAVPFAPFPSSSFTVGSDLTDHEVTDANTPGPAQFYQLEVEAE